jgi:hypothetical protein
VTRKAGGTRTVFDPKEPGPMRRHAAGRRRRTEAEVLAWFDAEGVPPEARHLVQQASLRYRRQGFELTVPWPAGPVDTPARAAAIAASHRRQERLYTFAPEDTSVEHS